MIPPKAYRALFVTLLGITLGCGDPSTTNDRVGELGATTVKVVGGWAATTAQIFATVEIRRAGAAAGFCSGTLGSLQVAAGHLASHAVVPGMVRSVLEVRVHERYDHDFIMGRSSTGAGQGGMGSPNDIALLFLSAPFEEIPTAPMLTAEREQELVRHGDVGFVAGYGVYDLEAHPSKRSARRLLLW
jgi:hypothetical protein